MIKPIKNEKDYQRALKRIETLWHEKNHLAKDELDVLSTLVEVYETKNHDILPPDPIEAIKFRMEQSGLSNSDVSGLFGGKNRVSEVLHKKRHLTVNMIKNISSKLDIPAESLIG